MYEVHFLSAQATVAPDGVTVCLSILGLFTMVFLAFLMYDLIMTRTR